MKPFPSIFQAKAWATVHSDGPAWVLIRKPIRYSGDVQPLQIALVKPYGPVSTLGRALWLGLEKAL
jgi:hypothetical protein